MYGAQLPGYPKAYPKLFPRMAGLGLQNVGDGLSLMANFLRRRLDLMQRWLVGSPVNSIGIIVRLEDAAGGIAGGR